LAQLLGYCGSEIERAREEFLKLPSIDRRKIAKEYRDAKARERAAERAMHTWDRRAGIIRLRQQHERALKAEDQQIIRMAHTKPRTPSGAAAFISYVMTDMEIGEHKWHMIALTSVAEGLAAMAVQS